MTIEAWNGPDPYEEFEKSKEIPELIDWGDPDEVKASKAHDDWVEAHFRYQKSNNTFHILVRYDYEIDLDKIKAPVDLLWLVHHMGGKTWMNKEHLREMIVRISKIKGWKPYPNG